MRSALPILLILALAAPAAAATAPEGMRLSLGSRTALDAPAGAARPAWVDAAGLHLDLGLSRELAFGPALVRRPEGRLLRAEGRLAIGGFVGWSHDAFRVTGTLAAAETGHRAELAAGWDDGATAFQVRLGGEWGADGTVASFSPNPLRYPGLYGGEEAGGYDLSLSLSHAITPNLVVGGVAAAMADSPGTGGEDGGSLLFGAAIGLRF